MAEMLASPEQRKFGQDKLDTLTAQCKRCEVKNLCNGGCPKERFSLSRDGEPVQNYLCAGLELFYKHTQPTMRTMVQLLQRNLPPSRIMELTADEDKKRGTKTCPCGSGIDFISCHGNRDPRSRFSGVDPIVSRYLSNNAGAPLAAQITPGAIKA
jgi:uncharacterized protein